MFKVAIKSLLAHKIRFFMTTIAVVLGVGLVAGTFIFTDTIDAQFDSLFDEIYAGTDVSVRAASTDFNATSEPFPASVLASVLAVDGVKNAEGGVSTESSQVIGRDGKAIGGQGPPTLGFSWGEIASMNPMKIKDGAGRPPTAPGEVAIDANTVKTAGFALGDIITVTSVSGPEDFELVGIASFGDQDSLLGATIVLFELEEAQRVFGFGDELTGITIKADDGVETQVLTDRVSAVLPIGVEAVTSDTERNEQSAEINEALGFISIGLLAFAGVSIFVGAFIIQNTFRIVVAQRTRELALLRAIGATGRQVRTMVIVEAAFVGLVGSIVGIAFGFVMAIAIQVLGNAVGLSTPGGGLALQTRTVVVALVVGMTLTLVSSFLPARKASKILPIEAMREGLGSAPRRSLRNRAIVGSSILGVGVLLLGIGLFGSVGQAIIFVAAGAAIAFIGVSVLAPLAAKPLANIIGWPLPRVFGVAGLLARENTKRKPRRTAATASALMVGVALVAFFSVFGASTKASISETIFELFPSDLTFQSTNPSNTAVPHPISPAFATELETYSELSVVSRLQIAEALLGGDLQPIAGIDLATVEQVLSLEPVGDAIAALEKPDSVIVSSSLLESASLKVGDIRTAEFPVTGFVDLIIVGAFDGDALGDFFVSTETFVANFRYVGDGLVFANVADGVTIAEAQEAISPTVLRFANVKAQTKSEIVTEIEGQIDQALALFTSLLLFAVIIAVIGITNTLMLSVFERTREIGLLRAVGMTRRQVRRMIRWEAVIIAVFGAVLGVVIGVVLGWAVVRALADEGFGALSIPVFQIVLALVLAGIAGMLAAYPPARKASRMNILDAISSE